MPHKLFTSLPRNIREEVVNCSSIEPLLNAEKGRKFFENYLVANKTKELGDADTKVGDFIKYWELWKAASSILETKDSAEKIRLTSQSLENDFTDVTELVTEQELNAVKEAVNGRDVTVIDHFLERCKGSAQQLLDENVFPAVARDLKEFCSRRIKLNCNIV